jgi:uncharacterized membrane protein
MTPGKDHTFVARGEGSPGTELDSAARQTDEGLKTEEAAAQRETDTTVVTPASERASQPLVPPASRLPSAPEQAQVHVPENLHDLIAGIPITPEEAAALKRSRQLNEVIHHMLSLGLAISTAVMMAGLALDVILHRDVPAAVPRFEEVGARVMALRPSGFLALGLLLLIATPILRVLGSFFAFAYERDWRYVGITLVVILILSVTLFVSRG